MSWVKINCLWCGKEKAVKLKYFNRGEGKYCDLSCSANHRNSLRPPAESKSRLSKIARETYIQKKGEPICATCGAEHADIHHRNQDKTDNRMSNLLPLCRSCHIAHHNHVEPKRRREIVLVGDLCAA